MIYTHICAYVSKYFAKKYGFVYHYNYEVDYQEDGFYTPRKKAIENEKLYYIRHEITAENVLTFYVEKRTVHDNNIDDDDSNDTINNATFCIYNNVLCCASVIIWKEKAGNIICNKLLGECIKCGII